MRGQQVFHKKALASPAPTRHGEPRATTSTMVPMLFIICLFNELIDASSRVSL